MARVLGMELQEPFEGGVTTLEIDWLDYGGVHIDVTSEYEKVDLDVYKGMFQGCIILNADQAKQLANFLSEDETNE